MSGTGNDSSGGGVGGGGAGGIVQETLTMPMCYLTTKVNM